MGGSLGARTLNLATAAALPRLREAGVQLLWQTGKLYFPEAQQQAAPTPPTACTPWNSFSAWTWPTPPPTW